MMRTMICLHPEKERKRLIELYASMSDGELQKVATNLDELSDIARSAIMDELSRRGTAEASDEEVFEEAVHELQELVTIHQFRDLPEAMLAHGALSSAGIESYLIDDNMVRTDWFISNLLGGVKLRVRTEDAEAAREILAQPVPDQFDVEGVGQFEQPRCPRCTSLNITDPGLNKPVSYASMFFVPIPISSSEWKCEDCGNRWVGETPDSLNDQEID